MALPLDMKTYSDMSCGDVKVFEDEGPDVERKQMPDQNDTIDSEANVSVNCDDTPAQVLSSIVAEVSKKSVRCEDKSSNSVPEVVHKSVQCEEIIGSNGLNHSTTESMNKAVQCEDFQENSVNESTFDHSHANDTMNCSDGSHVSKIVNLSSISTQTDVNDDILENLQKKIKEKDTIISLKEEIIVKLQDSLKSKEEEIEKMSASVELSRQSIIPTPEQPSTASPAPQQPRSRGRPVGSGKKKPKMEQKDLEGAKEVTETDSPRRGRRSSQAAKTNVEKETKESPESTRRATRNKAEEPKVEEDAGKSKRGGKRKITDKSEGESPPSKQVKMPAKERRGDSAVTKGKSNKDGKSYSLRNRK